MKKDHFDVIIAGGGPAGSAAAYTLAARGIDVCVVDKCIFPRDKLCGGLLTLRSKKIFDRVFGVSWDPVIDAVSRGVVFYHKDRFLNSVLDYKDLYFTRRYNFDNYLLGLVKKMNATVFLGNDVRNIDLDGRKVALGNGVSLSYKYLIGADGVNSRVAGALFGRFFDKSTLAYGLEMEVPITGRVPRIVDPEIYFGFVKWGYGWVFPKKETLTVGISGLHGKAPDLGKSFAEFIRMRFGDMPEAQLKGHYIPFGNYRRRPGRDNVLLCGDAAGLADPITGEGIAFAMQSGHHAALSVMEDLQRKRSKGALGLYMERCRSITRALDRARMLRTLIFPEISQHLFISVFPKTRSVARKHMDLMADEIEYGQYMRFIMAGIGKYVVKKIVPPVR
ncbi:MAG: geranylgeranyl reductase family protein [Candidatus Sulfobium sp.]